ncbi:MULTISPECIES: hypothetical protein [unclassified Pseudomonas]|uniref:hypothetical protein n=1 Tax=unclassified Pseudomonas TaxID=196821 RepID=UPI00087147AE|nr:MULTISPECIES: hypothetical protein [unclassified Pseudomonas]SCW83003.1 hypothetical protein SAMN03159424_03463 [Pseudomonas sp. NFACC05-1]SCZ41726.1 hypothetical protein SAMN03159405_04646 [Pseudomonas sp. NFACC44-2]SDA88077.1 hypothetical protein SAMN03159429_05327 [Pseudomonas sp. NFACC51]SDY29483.1 hypothetical protein SAMN03159474_05139 [Pseudomonas sp. NFACC08-1]SEJ85876.1 hypothetical protein SAMN03159298_04724 [Pseudomonas sp. NFACC07-1]
MTKTLGYSHQDNNGFYEKTLAQFNYAPLDVLYKYIESLNTQEHSEILDALMKQARLNDGANQQVQAWQQERIRPNRTRLIVKVINHTERAFPVGENDINLDDDERDFLSIRPWDILAFKLDFIYSRQLGSRSKDMYKNFMMFGDDDAAFLFNFGLRVNTTFGVISSTLTPVRTNRVISVGATPIKCSTRITHSANEEPYGFTVEITLT